MLSIVIIITTMLLIERGFTVGIDEWLSLYDTHIYSRWLDTIYRLFRVVGWFIFTFVLVSCGFLLITIALRSIAYWIKKYWLLNYKF